MTVGSRLLEMLGALETAAPVVLAVDDVQWVDQQSVRALVFALRRLVADPVLVLLVVREEAAAHVPESVRRLVSEPAAAAAGWAGSTSETCGTSRAGSGSATSPTVPPGA